MTQYICTICATKFEGEHCPECVARSVVQPVVSLDSMLATMQGHPWRHACPKCGEDCSSVALVDLVYTWEPCNCDVVSSVHLVETVYHRKCLAG